VAHRANAADPAADVMRLIIGPSLEHGFKEAGRFDDFELAFLKAAVFDVDPDVAVALHAGDVVDVDRDVGIAAHGLPSCLDSVRDGMTASWIFSWNVL